MQFWLGKYGNDITAQYAVVAAKSYRIVLLFYQDFIFVGQWLLSLDEWYISPHIIDLLGKKNMADK